MPSFFDTSTFKAKYDISMEISRRNIGTERSRQRDKLVL